MQSKYNLRGIVGKDLNEKEIKKFAKNIIGYIYENKCKPYIIIGKDNRVSSDYIFNLINSVLLKYGVETNFVGVATTPELAYLTKKFKFSLGVMITASHNSYEYNGFKCFNNTGEMIDIYNKDIKRCKIEYKKIVDIGKFTELYIRELKNKLNTNKLKCVFDCANGVMLDIVRKVFPRQQIIGRDASGKYVNDCCGSQYLDNIISICKKYKKIGFAFDGDGDRVVAIDECGQIIDGDKILYILATQKLGFGDRVVGTQISSLGLEISLRRLGVLLIREKVGAKYVAKRMKKENVILGGETCGHIFLSSTISDGIVTAIELINILNRTGFTFTELLSGYKSMYRITKDVSIDNIKNVREIEDMDKGVRVIVRKSGTENLLRILVEGESEDLVKAKLEEVLKEYIINI